MSKTDTAKRAHILQCICEGNSMRSTSRLMRVSINTVMKLVVEVGESADWFQDTFLRNVPVAELQLDEIWAFVNRKEETKDSSEGDDGDAWTWTALDPVSKLMLCWHVGKRSEEDAKTFCFDVAARVRSGRIQVTSDGYGPYICAVPFAFHDEPEIHFGRLVKRYEKDAKGHDVVVRADKIVALGNPDVKKISTSLVERSNLTLRMGCRRFTRKTNAFSKKFENHCAAVALHMFHYNFVRRHMTLKTTPAVAAGMVDEPWTLEDLLAMHDAYRAKNHPANRPKTYRKRDAK